MPAPAISHLRQNQRLLENLCACRWYHIKTNITLDFVQGSLKHSAMMLMIINCKLAVKHRCKCFPHHSFLSCIKAWFQISPTKGLIQQTRNQRKLSQQLYWGLDWDPQKRNTRWVWINRPLTVGNSCQYILVSKTDNIPFPNLWMDSLFPWVSHPLPFFVSFRREKKRVQSRQN